MSKIILNGIEYSNGITYQELQPVIYSETEREIGVWTDGKPLYQKTWTGLNVTPSYNSWSNVIPNNANIETLVRWQALSNGDYKNIDGAGVEWQVTSSYIRAEYNQNVNVRTIEILTLQYTKTTDVAGSGSWTPSGANAVHYDGNEKVIGTWFGETLYEKTFHLSNKSISVGKNIIVSISDLSSLTIDKVIGTVNGCITLSGGTYIINIPYGIGATSYATADYDSAEGIRVWRGGSAFTANDIYLTIQYTKTS